MTGVRFTRECGWEGLCSKKDGGCGEWWPLNNACWAIQNTIKRCRACHNARQRTPEQTAHHRMDQRRYRANNPEQHREYQRRYRATEGYKAQAAIKAARARERRANIRALITAGLDAS